MQLRRRWSMTTTSRQHAMRDAVERAHKRPGSDRQQSGHNLNQGFGGLPQELLDMVIDCLCDDRPALKACALTCQAWLPRTRHHIHRRVTIIDEYDPDDDGEMASPEPETDHPSDVIARYVEELRIFGLPPPWELDSYDLPLDGPAEGLRDNCLKLWASLERFTHLTRLTLIAFEWRYSPMEEARFCALFQNITHLDLAQCNFRSLGHFLTLLAAFPNMTTLSLTRVFWSEHEAPLDAPLRPGITPDSPPRLLFPTKNTKPSLRKLRSFSFVGDGCTPYVVSAIAGWLGENVGQLRDDMEFVWSCIWCPGLVNLPLVLSVLGKSIQHMELHIAGRTQFNETIQGVPFLRENRCLRSLLFFVSCSPPRDDTLYLDDPLDPLLMELDSPYLARIEFACCFQPNLPWSTNTATVTASRIDEILSRPAFAKVSRLVFSFSYKFEECKDEIQRLMGKCLPRAIARGILRLEFGWTFNHV